MIKIKFMSEFPQWPFERQTPNSKGIWQNCKFYFNQDLEEYDYCVVFDNLLTPQSILCSNENIIFITAEPESVRNYDADFLKQFATIVTSHTAITHGNVIHMQQGLPWFVGRRVQNSKNISFSKNYDELKSINNYNKSKLLSVICSNKTFTSGHKKRYDFCMSLKEYFGDQIDIFGSGINDIEDKWDAVYSYKYHIVIENSTFKDYWTEKLSDCYLGGAYPFYYGCPNLNDYFDQLSYSCIDINDFDGAVKVIENAINNNFYEQRYNRIIEAKNLVLDKYNLFNVIANIAESNHNQSLTKSLITIMPEQSFGSKKQSFIKKILAKLQRRE